MNTKSILAASAVAVSSALAADLLPLDPFATDVKSVPSESETEANRVLTGANGEVWKTGEGEWSVPRAQFDKIGVSSVVVSEGSLKVTAEDAAVSAAELPQSVRDKAFFWVDATDPNADHLEHYQGDAEKIARWYDVRETSTSSRRYPVADAENCKYFGGGNDPYPRLRDVSSEDIVQMGGRAVRGLYFNAYIAGSRMQWRDPNGAVLNAGVRQFFAVHVVRNSWGSLVGSFDENGAKVMESPFLAPSVESAAASLAQPYFRGGNNSFMRNGKTYLDGERIDGTAEIVRKGLHLLEAQASPFFVSNADNYCNAFFTDGFGWTGFYQHAGGDTLCEAILFTNQLSEVERVQVQDYLARKWNLPCSGQSRQDVTLAEGTTLAVGDGDGLNVSARGAGTVVKTGTGTYVSRGAVNSAADAAAIDVQEGAVVLKRQAPLAVSAGKGLTSVAAADGVTVSVGPAAAGEASISAAVPMSVTKVGADVKKLRVRAGEVTFSSPKGPSLQVVSPGEVFIPNHSFEEWDEDGYYEKTGGIRLGVKPSTTPYHGWRLESGAVYWPDFNVPYEQKSEGMDSTSRSTYKVSIRPPDGHRAALLFGGEAAMSAEVTIPESGEYEFSIRLCGREVADGSYWNCGVAVSLRDGAGNTVADIGAARWFGEAEYRLHVFRTDLPAGTYRLHLRALAEDLELTALNQWAPHSCIFDDLHLRRVPKTDGVSRWPVPNGNLEHAVMCTSVNSFHFYDNNTIVGWTIDAHPTGWPGVPGYGGGTMTQGAGLVMPSTRNVWSGVVGDVFNASRLPRGGDVELYFVANGSSATTTFTPPAGRHYVQGDIAFGGDAGGAMEVLVTKGGETVSLGKVVPNSRIMLPRTWPFAFETDGSEAVTLKFLYSGTNANSLWLDDVCLADAYADETELVTDGGFEQAGTWTCPTVTDADGTVYGVGRFAYVQSQDAFGTDFLAGEYFCELVGEAQASQSVAIPRAGRYRLSFGTHYRVYDGANPLTSAITLTKGDTTVEIGTFTPPSKKFAELVFEFDVPEVAGDGAWTLTFAGKGKYWYNAEIDAVSIKAVPERSGAACPFARETKLIVSEGAKVRLDFDGTNTVEGVRLGGRGFRGLVSEKTCPDYISGPGVLNAEPTIGFSLFLR